LVTIAGVAPDVDALGLVVELMVRNSGNSLTWWSDYHHVLGYKVGSRLVVKLFACWLANRRSVATLLALAAFHLRLLCDLFGSRGPDGYQWPIPYLLPFPTVSFFLAWGRGYSPLECISKSIDAAFVVTLKKRFG
jgi:inner membrane protein